MREEVEELMGFMSRIGAGSMAACVSNGKEAPSGRERKCVRSYVRKYIEAVMLVESTAGEYKSG